MTDISEDSTANFQHQMKTLQADKFFEIEITGPSQAKTVMILVHGFGVKRDSRKLFTEITDAISDYLLVINGDFSEVHEMSTKAIPISMQAERLNRILQFVHETYTPDKIILLGHSQGCLTIGQAQPKNTEIILLAPPIIDVAKRFAATPGWNFPGSYLNQTGESILVRSDLVIRVRPEYWEDLHKINAILLYTQLATTNSVRIIFAEHDEVLGPQNALGNVPTEIIPEANHDFKDNARIRLLSHLKQALVNIQSIK